MLPPRPVSPCNRVFPVQADFIPLQFRERVEQTVSRLFHRIGSRAQFAGECFPSNQGRLREFAEVGRTQIGFTGMKLLGDDLRIQLIDGPFQRDGAFFEFPHLPALLVDEMPVKADQLRKRLHGAAPSPAVSARSPGGHGIPRISANIA